MLNIKMINLGLAEYKEKKEYATERHEYWQKWARRAKYESANAYERIALDRALF